MPKPRTRSKDQDPPVLGPKDVAPAAKDARTPIALLDPVVTYLSSLSGEEETADEIIAECFGPSDQAMPARVLSFLREVKRDPRLSIEARHGNTWISLVSGANPKQDPTIPADSAEVEQGPGDPAPAATPAAKTIGEQLAATQAQPRFAYPTTPGMPVMLLTEGQDPAPAKILKVHDHGATCTYDLELSDGPIQDVPAHRLAPHPEAERVYADQATRLACLERHQGEGIKLSDQYFLLKSEEVRVAKQLSDLRKRIDGLADEIAEHGRSDAIQTMLSDILGTAAAKEAAAKDTRSELQKRLEAGDVMEWDDLGCSFPALLAAVLPATASTGKPAKVKPVDFGNMPHVLVDVQEAKAVLMPAYEGEEWADVWGEKYGEPADTPALVESKGGRWCGMPVKVGRATLYLGPDESALILRVPAGTVMPGREPEMALSGKDAAAGE